MVDGQAPGDGWQLLFDALEPRDAEALVDAALGTGPESRTALAMVGALAQNNDPRLPAAPRTRLLEGLRLRVQDPDAYEAQQAWSQLDPEAFFEELARRADSAGILDQRLLRFIDTHLVNALSDERRRAAAAAFERIVRRQVVLGVAPFQSLDWWLTLDGDAAGLWLSTSLDPARLDGRTAQAVIRPLDRCGGRPFAVWRTRLGETSGEPCFWVRAADGTASLFIETDKDDRLIGWSMR